MTLTQPLGSCHQLVESVHGCCPWSTTILFAASADIGVVIRENIGTFWLKHPSQ